MPNDPEENGLEVEPFEEVEGKLNLRIDPDLYPVITKTIAAGEVADEETERDADGVLVFKATGEPVEGVIVESTGMRVIGYRKRPDGSWEAVAGDAVDRC